MTISKELLMAINNAYDDAYNEWEIVGDKMVLNNIFYNKYIVHINAKGKYVFSMIENNKETIISESSTIEDLVKELDEAYREDYEIYIPHK